MTFAKPLPVWYDMELYERDKNKLVRHFEHIHCLRITRIYGTHFQTCLQQYDTQYLHMEAFILGGREEGTEATHPA